MRIYMLISLTLILAIPAMTQATDDDWPLSCGKMTAAGFDKALVSELTTDTRNYNVLTYGLHITLDPVAGRYTGSLLMTFSPLISDMTHIVMDAKDLEITGVSGRGGALDYSAAGDSLRIELPSLKSVTMDSVRVEYGAPFTSHTGLTFNYVDADDPAQGYAIASFSEPEFARTWWPCKDRPSDKALVDVWVTAPDHLVAAANGVNMGRVDNGDGTATTHWREGHPIATYLVSIAVAEYAFLGETCLTVKSPNVPITNYILQRNLADAAIDFAPLCDMMRFMEQIAGPYRFADEKYGHAEVLNFTTAAMEHQTLTSYGYGMLRGNNAYDWVVIHELAHQWFGDSLTPATWADIWLNEGFARYAEALWIEHNEGREAYLERMDYLTSGNGWETYPPVYDSFPVLHIVVYNKGAWILHMLRGRLGDADFFDLLDRWANDGGRPYGVVNTEDFITLANRYSPDIDLHGFFDPWLNETTTPKLDIDWTASEGPHGQRTRLELRLTDVSGVDFDNIYPLKVTTSTGVEWGPVRLQGASTRFVQDFNSEIQSVELDPEHWVSWRTADVVQPSLQIASLAPNPATGGTVHFTYMLEESTALQLEIFDVMGRRVFARDLPAAAGAFQENEYIWAGCDDGGQRTGSGVYWLRLTGGGYEAIRKFTLIN